MPISNKTIPSRKKVLAAHGMREAGLKTAAIAKALGIRPIAVERWFNQPETYDPYYDEVAVERALQGDAAVYDSLTIFEYRLVVALLERADTDEEPASNRFPEGHRERVRLAIRRRRKELGQGVRPKHCKIAETKLTTDVRRRVLEMRQRGTAFEAIAFELGISRRTVFRALDRAA